MKIRKGFVSNSSSSSFIIGWAKVGDLRAALELIESIGYPTSSIKIVSTKYIIGNEFRDWEIHSKKLPTIGKYYYLESFTSAELEIKVDESKLDDLYLIVDYLGDEGDHKFWDGDWYDYDIDEDFFDKEIRKIIKAIAIGDCGLEVGTYWIGAGRNG